MSFLFRQFPAFHHHHVRIHPPGAFQRGSQVLCFRSGWRIVLLWPRELSSEDAAGQGWKKRVTGQLESSRIWIWICKGWGSPAEHKSGCQTSKLGDKLLQKCFFSVHWTFCMLLYMHSSVATCLYILPFLSAKQVIISKICKCSSWPYEQLWNCNVRVWNPTQNGNI